VRVSYNWSWTRKKDLRLLMRKRNTVGKSGGDFDDNSFLTDRPRTNL
jgi:hypothetical protein